MSAEIEVLNLPQPIHQPAANPMELLSRALDRGADMQQLQQLMDLQERWEANQARKAFVAAMSEFKRNPPKIIKDKHVEFGNTKYDHATLGAVCSAIIEGLAKVGISHRWTVQQAQLIEVTCVLTHELGHEESVMLKAGPDKSGSKNDIQAIGSAVTYLQRYSLFCATGLAAMQDDDGAATGEPTPPPGQKVNPRPDVSKVDQVRAEQLFKSIVDILSQDIEEKDKALDLVDIHEQLRTDDAMYSLIADKLAKDGIINKSGFKALIKLGLEESRKDLRL